MYLLRGMFFAVIIAAVDVESNPQELFLNWKPGRKNLSELFVNLKPGRGVNNAGGILKVPHAWQTINR